MTTLNAIRAFYIDYQILLFGSVLLYLCYRRYSVPKQARATTTFGKYALGYLAYSFVAVLAFLFITVFPDLIIETIKLLQVDAYLGGLLTALEIWKVQFPTVVALALLVALVGWVPPVRRAHEDLLEQMRGFANIPREIRRLAGQLFRSRYDIVLATADEDGPQVANPCHVKNLKEILAGAGIDEKDWRFNEQNNLRYDFAKAASLYLNYRAMLAQRPFSYYVSLFSEKDQAIAGRFEALRKTAGGLIRDIRSRLDREAAGDADADTLETQGLIRDAFEDDIDAVRRELRGYQREVCEEIARAVLLCKRTRAGRRRAVCALGFQYLPSKGDIVSQCCIALIAVFVLVMMVLPLMNPTGGSANPSLLAKVFLSMFTAVGIAIAVKNKSHAIEGAGARPVVRTLGLPAYLGAALAAALFGLLISLCVDYVRLRNVRDAVEHFNIAPLAMPAMMAGVLTFQMDRNPAARRRWKEAAIQAAAMVLAAFAVIFVWNPILATHGIGSPLVPDAAAGPPACITNALGDWLRTEHGCITRRHAMATTFALIFGVTLGALIPAAYFKQRAEFLEPQTE